MEENNNYINTGSSWSEIISLGSLAVLVILHASMDTDFLLYCLVTAITVSSVVHIYQLWLMWQGSITYAQGVLLSEPYSIWTVTELNPLSLPSIARAITFIAAGIYVCQLSPETYWFVVLLAIVPQVMKYMVYDRVLRFIQNPTLQEWVEEESKLVKQDQRRSVIVQEELNKVMPKVMEAAKQRWSDEGLSVEETNEYYEPDESDQRSESTTDSDD